MMKLDIADGFYRVNLAIKDIPQLGVVFPTLPGPPAFSTATETAADTANQHLHLPAAPLPHHPDELSHKVYAPLEPNLVYAP